MESCKYFHKVIADIWGLSSNGNGCLLSGGRCFEKCKDYIEYDANDEITKQLDNFIYYKLCGWETELTFEVCYDAVHDLIDKEKFLNLCQDEIKSYREESK